jgi:hypothetical protein
MDVRDRLESDLKNTVCGSIIHDLLLWDPAKCKPLDNESPISIILTAHVRKCADSKSPKEVATMGTTKKPAAKKPAKPAPKKTSK